jgi:AraC family transcriptional regulator, melibiose operon regulatory protein
VVDLWMHRGAPPLMAEAHHHDDVEFNLVLRGRLDYVFGGRRIAVPAGRLAVFWAATPHRLLPDDAAPGSESTDARWMHVALADVLRWGLPAAARGRLLRDGVILVAASGLGDLAAAFDRWDADRADAATLDIALLEIQALLRRVLLGAAPAAPSPDAGVSDAAIAMAAHLTAHAAEPITVGDVAAVVHLHPSSAMARFRAAFGMSIGEYLTRCRIAEAQRLLVTTTVPVAEVGHRAGFGSSSAFYAAFTRAAGRSPGAYRRELPR